MVSFWPFKGDDTSAASFERVLSQLSAKISKASAQNDRLRQYQRKYKVLWTLYTSFAYIIIAAILVLVTGWDRWGAFEGSIVAGGPLVIYGVRTSLDSYYSYRVAKSQSYLNDLYKQRDTSIEKLKTATKYNTTQELLDKYGQKPANGNKGQQRPGQKQSANPIDGSADPKHLTSQRTGFAPPPTANIQRAPTIQPKPPLENTNAGADPVETNSLNTAGPEPGEEFAPNAFSPTLHPPLPQPQSTQYAEGPKWYDRVLDVMLGEDETQAKHRIVLICQQCRLVNGQAPPGVRTLGEIGRWRCSQCHAWNGVESEETKILREMVGAARPSTGEDPSSGSPQTSMESTDPVPIADDEDST